MKNISIAEKIFRVMDDGISTMIVKDEGYKVEFQNYKEALEKYTSELNEDQMAAFEEYQTARHNLSWESKKAAFIIGFNIGLKLMSEAHETDYDDMFQY